jgi:hypothetical protein
VKRSDNVVLCFSADAARAFEPDASLLRGLGIFSFAPSELASFSIQATGLNETVRRNEDGGYQLEEPKGFQHDGSLVADTVQALGTLQAVRWVPALDDATLGLKSPRLHATVTLTGDAGVRTLDVGAATSDGYFARASSDAGVFVLPRSVVEALSAPLIDRTLLPVPGAELTSIEVEANGRRLILGRPTATATWRGTLKTEVLDAILALKAEQTVHLGAAKPVEGFANPSVTVRFGAQNGQRYRLLIGARDTLDDSPIAYARLDGVDATFALSGRTVSLLRDTSDLH